MREVSPCISLHEACNDMASFLVVAKWLAEKR